MRSVHWRWIAQPLVIAFACSSPQGVAGDDAHALLARMNALRQEHRLKEAIDAGRQAALIVDQRAGVSEEDVAACHFALACLLADTGDRRQAAAHADRSRRAIRSHVSKVLSTMDDREQIRFLKAHDEERLHAVLSLGLLGREDADVAALSAGWLANGKAVAQEAATELMPLARESGVGEAESLVERIAALRGQLSGVLQAVPPPGHEAEHRDLLREIEREEQRALERLATLVAGLRPRDPWVPIDAVREAIPAGTVLVDIARFTPRGFVPPGASQGTEAPRQVARYAAWIVPPAARGRVTVLDLGEADAIDDMVAELRAAIEGDAQRDGVILREGEAAAERKFLAASTPLARRTIRPIFEAATKVLGVPPEELVISPDGALWLLPWASLPVEDGRYAVEAVAIDHVTSSRELALTARSQAALASTPPLIIAAPDYETAAGGPQAPSESSSAPDESTKPAMRRRLSPVEPLPGALREAYLIAPAIGRLAGVEPIMATDGGASETLMKRVSRPSLLVLSTHGFFMPDQSTAPSVASLLLGGRGRDAPLEPADHLFEHPLTRCGLALAGCNAAITADAGVDDGILTGLEIVGCDLRGTDLVVLSACQTALGDVRVGEGVAGLRQAFRLAGARTVVATLWSVADKDTVELMTPLFARLADGTEPARALRAAQLAVIASRRAEFNGAHPFSWAAFTVTGR